MSLAWINAALGVAKKDGKYVLRTIKGKQNFDCEAAYTDENVDEKVIDTAVFSDDTKTIYLKYTVKRTGVKQTKEMALFS